MFKFNPKLWTDLIKSLNGIDCSYLKDLNYFAKLIQTVSKPDIDTFKKLINITYNTQIYQYHIYLKIF